MVIRLLVCTLCLFLLVSCSYGLVIRLLVATLLSLMRCRDFVMIGLLCKVLLIRLVRNGLRLLN